MTITKLASYTTLGTRVAIADYFEVLSPINTLFEAKRLLSSLEKIEDKEIHTTKKLIITYELNTIIKGLL